MRPTLPDRGKGSVLEWRDDSFDRTYVNHVAEALEKGVELFRKKRPTQNKHELQAYAPETPPKLQQHLKHAEQLRRRGMASDKLYQLRQSGTGTSGGGF
ncbi:DUF4142 domain-containing protein [Streptomyces sp. NPDC020298]|uniref:DUF4142 domain-containing protein n=1 Tax=unclassified Streptomyces TaxID=2593676 RepID=UPI0033F2737F